MLLNTCSMALTAVCSSSAACLLPAASVGTLHAFQKARSMHAATLGRATWRPPSAIVAAAAASQPCSLDQQLALVRHYTKASPPASSPVVATLGGDSLEGMQQPAAADPAAVAPLLPPRVKGITRKMILRQVNRTIIRRLARRATIGIPILGLYFVLKVLQKDSASLAAYYASGDRLLTSLYTVAVAAELVDVVAQTTISIGMGITSGLITLPAVTIPPALAATFGFAALPALPALLLMVDKASLACASLSCGAGLTAEAVRARREMLLAQSDSDDEAQKRGA